ncbi:MAG TPA: UDP-N-acetylmuramate dehydrogenase [Candidatus Cloacimonadota bacterium]|nr:UDP-N-acetylmuramate dehydrogenase [Candidatus Cloacimonadota bacterium]HPT72620.1 UDP-N-acetylmuramate dehydrogenase [Candidatus Cloacimonadota bacterium]
MNIQDELTKIVGSDHLLIDEPMKNHTHFQIGGPVDYLVMPGNLAELSQVIRFSRKFNIPHMVIGNGSNLLVRDKGIRGIVIKTTELKTVEIQGNQIYAECGITLEELSNLAMNHELTGMEFASGIPGTLGGAVVMNAGAYDGEMKDIVVESKFIDYDNELKSLSYNEHLFGYRTSYYQIHKTTVVSATLNLKIGNIDVIRARMEELHNQRWDKQPMDLPSGGSVFKRPAGFFVGKLVDDCGLRGTRIGDAQISDKHCGFIVNIGNATAQDVLSLIKRVQNTVFKRFGVTLEPELRIVGED